MATQSRSADITSGRYFRFDIFQRLEHLILLVSFSLLGITGLAQKYAGNAIADGTIKLFGGIEMARTVHHIFAITMCVLAAYHIVAVGYRIFVLRARMSMLPGLGDFSEWWAAVRYYLGLSKTPAKFGRFNYGEKMEYWAVVWGTIVMGITGFMMWNPITTTKLVPGEWIPAAKAAHGGEAVLAVLAIIIWHFYNVHIKTFNKSMFTGRLDEHQMAHEHGRELEAFVHGTAGRPIDPLVLRRRQTLYFPVAAVLLVIMGGAIIRFFTFENTAPIKTVPPAVNVAVLVTATPQPTPTRAPTAVPTAAPTQAPSAGGTTGSVASFADVQTILKTKCGTCHGDAATAGLSVTTYASLMKGGASGPVVVAKDPTGSPIVKKIEGGNHPGQLSADEMAVLKAWIAAGATGGTLSAAPAPTAAPQGATGGTSYADVQPIFEARCGTCHGSAATAGLNVTTYAALMKGSASGAVIVVKDADGSPLIKKVAGGGHPGQFTADELAAVKAWIAAGAMEAVQGSLPTPAPAAGAQVTFLKDIQPLFTAKCATCHGTMGGLTLTTFESVMHGGTSGPAVTPKDPDKSSIIKKQTAGGHPGQLSPEEIELVRKWIAGGAPEQ